MKQSRIFLSIAAISMMAIAWTTEVSAKGFPAFPTDIPQVEGLWVSQCVYDKSKLNYRQLVIGFQGETVFRTDTHYTDIDCAFEVENEQYTGAYHWVKPTAYGGYEIEYLFDGDSGSEGCKQFIAGEEILLEGGNLFLSQFMIGWGFIDKSIPLTKVVVK